MSNGLKSSLPPKYSWVGVVEIPDELSSGVLNMGARSYIPQLGRFLQPDPIPGGSANANANAFGDPVDTSDPSGALTYGISSWLLETNNQQDQEVIAREALEREEAERRVREAEQAAENAAGPQYADEEEWGEEEEDREEEVAYHPSEGRQASPLVEEGLLFWPEDGVKGSSAQKHLTTVCVLHSKVVGHPCLRTVSIFSEAVHFVKHAAKNAWHKFRRIVNYIIDAREKARDGISPYSGSQSANGCEVVGFLTTFGSPFAQVGAKAAFVVGTTIWASC